MRRIMFVLVFMIGICLSGEEKESGIKLIPVYEKTFEDTIVDVIFDTATVSLDKAKAMGWKEEAFNEEEKAKGKVTITYPCVLITKDKISFLDKGGKEKKTISRLVKGVKWEGKQGVKIGEGVIKVRKSKGGEYLGVVIPREGSLLGEGIKGDFVMYRKDGKEMWRLEGVYLSDGNIIPSPNGEYAIGLPPAEYPAGAPYIYTCEGMEELKVKEWDNGWKDGYAVEDFDFSMDGRYLVVGIYKFPVRDNGFLVLFDGKGKEIWKISTDKGVSYVKISNSGKYIAVIVTDRGGGEDIVVLSRKGDLLWEKTFSHWDGHALAFDPNEEKLFITWYNHKVYLRVYETKTGKELWRFYSDALLKNISFVDILFPKSSLYAFLIGSGGPKDALYIVSLDGKILQKIFYKDQLFTMQNYISEGSTRGIQLNKAKKVEVIFFNRRHLTVKTLRR